MAEKSGQSGPQETVATRTREPKQSETSRSRRRAGRFKEQGREFLSLPVLLPVPLPVPGAAGGPAVRQLMDQVWLVFTQPVHPAEGVRSPVGVKTP